MNAFPFFYALLDRYFCPFILCSRPLLQRHTSSITMSQPPNLLISDDDDTSQVSTPVLSQLPPSRPSSFTPDTSFPDPTNSSSAPPSNSSHLRLPIPTPSANLSQTSFAFTGVSEDEGGVDFDLPPEIASADISIAREFLC